MRRGTASTIGCRWGGVKRVILYGFCIGITLTLWCLSTTLCRADAAKRVLILHSNQSVLPATVISDAAIRQELQQHSPDVLDIFTEFLDTERFPGPEQAARTEAFLRNKYAGYKIDLLITTGPDALDFLVQRRTSLFANAPLIFTQLSEDAVRARTFPSGVVGVISRYDMVPTLTLALHLQPDATHLVVVTGTSARDRTWEARARNALHPFEERIDIRYLAGLPMQELLRELSQLPTHTIVLYLVLFQDGSGQAFIPRDVARKVAETANAPVYGIFETYLGTGIVGGNMDSYESVGAKVAQLGLRVLAGESPMTMLPPEPSANFVDWRQLQRWGLNRSNLPPGSIVRFKEPSLWKAYRWQIAIVFSLLIAQFFLIAALIAQAQRRRGAEQAAREGEERMTLATTSANLGLWHWDVPTGRLWVSDICRQIMGLSPQSDVGPDKFLGLAHQDASTADRLALEQPQPERRLDRAESRLVLPDGTERWIRAAQRTDFDVLGRPARMTGAIVDITQEKIAERESAHWRQELMHTTQVATLGELSGAMAHELNQPLTAILSNADAAHLLLSRKDCNLPEIRDILEDIVIQARRAGDVIRHLRTLFAKSDKQIRPLNINEVVADVLKLMHSDLVARRITVASRFASDLPAVKGDRVQLQQVLLNLIANACDAMAENEPGERGLTVITVPDGHLVTRVSVSDRGSGIEPEIADCLFKPFMTTKSQGLGLGLSICRSIIEAHGGRLWAVNNPERGATFCMALPTDGAAH